MLSSKPKWIDPKSALPQAGGLFSGGAALIFSRLMPIKTLKQKMAEGLEVSVMAISAFPSPKIIEVAGKFGDLDGVWIDQEHSGLPNLDAFARVAPTDYATVMRPMEGGASGIMMAQVRSVAEVEQSVRWMKYHPVGERGMFLGNFEAEFGTKSAPEHVADSNRDRWTLIQIETAEAVECVEGIAAVEGVDCLFVGPSDLSNNLGKPGNPMDPHVLGAIERIAAAAKANGKPWGVLSKTEEFALKCREMGCQLFSIAGDLDYINRGIAATKSAFPNFFS
jgi:4-hydroxy-2-oxoheptanedioate aldolase